MDNKLSELSKPAWIVGQQEIADFMRGDEALLMRGYDPESTEPALRMYSQEYVSALLAELETKDKRIAELETATIVPGALRCAKCQFQLTKTILCMKSGTTGAGDNKTEPCPNGCGPLWPVTWKQWAKEMDEQAVRYFDELKAVEAKLATPVRLPTTSGRLGVAYTRVIPEVIEAVRAAGFTVSEE